MTVVGGPGYYPGHESYIYAILKRTHSTGGHTQSRRQIATLKRPYLGLKKRFSAHQPLQNDQNSQIFTDAAWFQGSEPFTFGVIAKKTKPPMAKFREIIKRDGFLL